MECAVFLLVCISHYDGVDLTSPIQRSYINGVIEFNPANDFFKTESKLFCLSNSSNYYARLIQGLCL